MTLFFFSANHQETRMENAVDSESLYEWIDFSQFRGDKKKDFDGLILGLIPKFQMPHFLEIEKM